MLNNRMTHFERVEACEQAIRAFREGVRARDDAGMERAYTTLMALVRPILIRQASRLRWLSDTAVEEAYEAMYDRLMDNLHSLTFVSMETKFGSYLKSMPIRILQKVREKYQPSGVSFEVESLDAPMREGERANDETMADPYAPADQLSLRLDLRNALGQLPAMERTVVLKRMDGIENNVIAQTLGISPATATRIYSRALAQLKTILQSYEGGATP